MKKLLKSVLLTCIILAVLSGTAIYLLTKKDGISDEFSNRIATEQSDQGRERGYRYDTDKGAIPLMTSGQEKNVLNFDSNKDAYNVAVSTAARERLDRLIKRTTPTFEKPIIAANPFGTNENTFYFYFETSYRGMIRYTVMVEDASVPDHVRYVNNGQESNLSTVHEFTLSGLVPGMTNYIKIEVLDGSGAKREDLTYKYTVPNQAGAAAKLRVQKGKSKGSAANGLYFVFPKNDKKIYAYDNSGILRNTTNTESGHGKRIYQSGDSILYQVSGTKFAKVSALGRVTATAAVRGYGNVKDFSYDGYDNIYSLVTKGKNDYLLATSFKTGKTKEVFRFPKGVRANSLTAPKAGNIYIAGAKPSGVLKVTAVTGRSPKVAFVLGKKQAWNKTSLKKKVVEDKEVLRWNTSGAVLNLEDGLSDGTSDRIATYLQNNGRGAGISFTVDGKKKAVAVRDSFPVGKGGFCGCQHYEENYIISANDAGIYEEYDREGKVTKQFSLGKTVENVTKLSLNGMCFYGGN